MDFTRANFCGLSVPGELTLTSGDVRFEFKPAASRRDLAPTLACQVSGELSAPEVTFLAPSAIGARMLQILENILKIPVEIISPLLPSEKNNQQQPAPVQQPCKTVLGPYTVREYSCG